MVSGLGKAPPGAGPYYAATFAQWDRTSTLACIVLVKQKGGAVVSRSCGLWSPLHDGAGSVVVCEGQLHIKESWRVPSSLSEKVGVSFSSTL